MIENVALENHLFQTKIELFRCQRGVVGCGQMPRPKLEANLPTKTSELMPVDEPTNCGAPITVVTRMIFILERGNTSRLYLM